MYRGEFGSPCISCHKSGKNSSKFPIFEINSEVQKCLIYKVSPFIRVLSFWDCKEKIICVDCKTLLMQLYMLEQRLSENFENNNFAELSKNNNPSVKIGESEDFTNKFELSAEKRKYINVSNENNFVMEVEKLEITKIDSTFEENLNL